MSDQFEIVDGEDDFVVVDEVSSTEAQDALAANLALAALTDDHQPSSPVSLAATSHEPHSPASQDAGPALVGQARQPEERQPPMSEQPVTQNTTSLAPSEHVGMLATGGGSRSHFSSTPAEFSRAMEIGEDGWVQLPTIPVDVRGRQRNHGEEVDNKGAPLVPVQ